VIMPSYTVNGQAGPNPIANSPFGNWTALSSGGYQQIISIDARTQDVCSTVAGQSAPAQPVLSLVDQTTLAAASATLPPGFMCGSQIPPPPAAPTPAPIPPPAPFGDPSACQ
jgi:hypothetical protein